MINFKVFLTLAVMLTMGSLAWADGCFTNVQEYENMKNIPDILMPPLPVQFTRNQEGGIPAAAISIEDSNGSLVMRGLIGGKETTMKAGTISSVCVKGNIITVNIKGQKSEVINILGNGKISFEYKYLGIKKLNIGMTRAKPEVYIPIAKSLTRRIPAVQSNSRNVAGSP